MYECCSVSEYSLVFVRVCYIVALLYSCSLVCSLYDIVCDVLYYCIFVCVFQKDGVVLQFCVCILYSAILSYSGKKRMKEFVCVCVCMWGSYTLFVCIG